MSGSIFGGTGAAFAQQHIQEKQFGARNVSFQTCTLGSLLGRRVWGLALALAMPLRSPRKCLGMRATTEQRDPVSRLRYLKALMSVAGHLGHISTPLDLAVACALDNPRKNAGLLSQLPPQKWTNGMFF